MTQDMSGTVEIVLRGRFRLLHDPGDGEGPRDITPSSAKACGLIALLALGSEHTRTRHWCQDMLWSDRGRDQAAASLRQELSNLVRADPVIDRILLRSRRDLSLDSARIRVIDTDPSAEHLAEGERDFLEGIEIRDPAFEEWLHQARRARRRREALSIEAPVFSRTSAPRRAIRLSPASPPDTPTGFLERAIAHYTGLGLRETLSVDILAPDADLAPDRKDAMLDIGIRARAGENGSPQVALTVRAGADAAVIWSHSQDVPNEALGSAEDTALLHLCNRLVTSLPDALLLRARMTDETTDAGLMGHLAVRKIFTIDADQLIEADRLLESAYDMDPRGTYQAWRAQLRTIQMVEKFVEDRERLAWESDDFCQRAMALEPTNSMVLATVAHVRLTMNDNVIACHELALKAVGINPANPYAWDMLSTSKLYAGELEEAHRLAVKAHLLGAASPHSFWWDMGRCVTAALTGRADEALRMAELSHAMSPNFRPPLRYLVALYAALGRDAEAVLAARKLARLEPDFTMKRLALDEHYPISPLRKSGVLDPARLLALPGVK